MIPVDKLVEHDPKNGKYGDCMRASIASLLNLKTEDVPHFYETGIHEDYHSKLENFLKSKGFKIIYTGVEGTFNEDIYHLIFGKNPDGVPHACVGKNGIVVHDPNPSRAGLTEVDSFGFIVQYTDINHDNINKYAIYSCEW